MTLLPKASGDRPVRNQTREHKHPSLDVLPDNPVKGVPSRIAGTSATIVEPMLTMFYLQGLITVSSNSMISSGGSLVQTNPAGGGSNFGRE